MDANHADLALSVQDACDTLKQELKFLDNKLSESYNVISQKWIGTELPILWEKLQGKQMEKIKHYNDEILGHKSNINKITSMAETKKKELEQRVQQITELKQTLEILTIQTQSALQQREKLLLEQQGVVQDIERQKKDLKDKSKQTQQKIEELEKTADLFKDRLDLRFKKISGGRIQYCLSSIDRDNPEFTCYFCLKINSEDRTYIDCSPDIPEVERLQRELNMSNNLRSFVIGMRKAFVSYVNHENHKTS